MLKLPFGEKSEKEKSLKNLQYNLLAKFDKMRHLNEEKGSKSKKRKENKLENMPPAYVERNLATIIKTKEKLKEKKKLTNI